MSQKANETVMSTLAMLSAVIGSVCFGILGFSFGGVGGAILGAIIGLLPGTFVGAIVGTFIEILMEAATPGTNANAGCIAILVLGGLLLLIGLLWGVGKQTAGSRTQNVSRKVSFL